MLKFTLRSGAGRQLERVREGLEPNQAEPTQEAVATYTLLNKLVPIGRLGTLGNGDLLCNWDRQAVWALIRPDGSVTFGDTVQQILFPKEGDVGG